MSLKDGNIILYATDKNLQELLDGKDVSMFIQPNMGFDKDIPKVQINVPISWITHINGIVISIKIK